jgi:rhamnogalacturonyl hydrolase YesR
MVPRGAPNLVCTTFVANSLLSVYEALGGEQYLQAAVSAASYITDELFWTEGDVASFSYPRPGEKTLVHNANLLAAAFLCRIARHAPKDKYVDVALKAARFSVSRQRDDGSWLYGDWRTQEWIDNFHTGYNLCALRDLGTYTNSAEFQDCLQRGYRFYVDHFIREDGAAKYFHDRTYPIDAHCVAQTIITLVELSELDPRSLTLAHRAYRWAMDHMWNEKGYFYYRVLPFCTIRTSYMRWSQAWMLLALATMAEREGLSAVKERTPQKSESSEISV